MKKQKTDNFRHTIKMKFSRLILFLIEKTVGMNFFVKTVGYEPIVKTGSVKPTFIGSVGHYDVLAKAHQWEQAANYWHNRWKETHDSLSKHSR